MGIALGTSAFAAPNAEDGLQGFSGSNGRGFSGSNGRGFSGSNGRGFSGSNGRGFSGSNGRGFSGSNGRGFSGSNGRGLDDSSALGFSGSNGRGFSGSNGRGFSGSNGRGFSGSNGRGFSGSNGRGLDDSSALGFSGSNGRGFSGSNGRSSDQSAGSGFGGGFDLAAMGTVDAVTVDDEVATLSVAGQSFNVSLDDAASFAIGDYVVAGAADAEASALVYHVGLPYVPGVSAVRVKAPVASVDPSIGTLTVGTLTVNYSAHLAAAPTDLPLAGDSVEIVGVQPTLGGTLVVGSSGEGLYITSSIEQADSGAGRQ